MKKCFNILLFLILTCNLYSIPQDSVLTFKLDSIVNYANQLMKANHIPGMSITVMIDSNIVLSKQFGYSDLSTKEKVNKNTKFRIASLSKIITSCSVMKLIEMGKISLDSSIRTYVPQFSKKRWRIPVKYLLNHTSGIRHYRGNEFYSPGNYHSIQDAINIFNNDTLLFEPGTKVSYSSYGYNLLGAMIENVSKKSFAQFVYEYILSPIKCYSIIPDNTSSSLINTSKFYIYSFNSIIKQCPEIDLNYKLPTGGYLSTTDDFAKLSYNIFHGTILNDSILKIYKTPTYLLDKKETLYSLGWRISEVKKHNLYWHLGSTYGASSAVAVDPKKKNNYSLDYKFEY